MKRLAAFLMMLLFAGGIRAAEPELLLVVGAEGEEAYSPQFRKWSENFSAAAKAGAVKTTTIGADPAEKSPDLPRVQAAIEKFAADGTEPLWIVLLGHGTFNSGVAKFNLRGEDIAADAMAGWLRRFQRPVVLVCGFAGSGAWLKPLAAPGRIVLTATRSGSEVNFARFPGYLSEAIASEEADLDRDGQTSLLEAWIAAARETSDFYQGDGRLATEHSLLDDNGDGLGTPPDWFTGTRAVKRPSGAGSADGLRAAQVHLVRAAAERELTPEQRAERDNIELEVETLRGKKPGMKEDEYFAELERLMLRLAKIYAQGT